MLSELLRNWKTLGLLHLRAWKPFDLLGRDFSLNMLTGFWRLLVTTPRGSEPAQWNHSCGQRGNLDSRRMQHLWWSRFLQRSVVGVVLLCYGARGGVQGMSTSTLRKAGLLSALFVDLFVWLPFIESSKWHSQRIWPPLVHLNVVVRRRLHWTSCVGRPAPCNSFQAFGGAYAILRLIVIQQIEIQGFTRSSSTNR